MTIYGQTEVTRDQMQARADSGRDTVYEAATVALHDFDTPTPRVTYTHHGQPREVRCDFIAGCDGFHGISRASVPAGALQLYAQVYPCGWLGVLADTRPVSDELIYSHHARGFALCSIWVADAHALLHPVPNRRHRRAVERRRLLGRAAPAPRPPDRGSDGDRPLDREKHRAASQRRRRADAGGARFLAGDAAHIVPPTGAKGLNLALADIRYLSHAVTEFYAEGSRAELDDLVVSRSRASAPRDPCSSDLA